MTETKRATWREFVEWTAQIEWDSSDVGSECWSAKRLRAAAWVVATRGEAVAATIGAVDYDPETVVYLIGRWTDALRAQGISPPADPPSVAEVLESVASSIDELSRKLEQQARTGAIGDPIVSHDPVLFGWSCAFMCAAEVARSKAKEFT